MHEKRYFHLVVIIDDNLKSKNNRPIQTQMLFILIAKSGDERNKWTSYLQELTGKMSQSDKQMPSIDLTLNPQPSSTTSLLSLTSHTSSSTLASQGPNAASTLTPSYSSSALTVSSANSNTTTNININNNDSTNLDQTPVSTNLNNNTRKESKSFSDNYKPKLENFDVSELDGKLLNLRFL